MPLRGTGVGLDIQEADSLAHEDSLDIARYGAVGF